MEDIVNRLRNYKEFWSSSGEFYEPVDVCLEAADEIERLRERIVLLEDIQRNLRGSLAHIEACQDGAINFQNTISKLFRSVQGAPDVDPVKGVSWLVDELKAVRQNS